MKVSFLETPEFLSLPIFGVSISPLSIKLVKLKKKKQGLIPVVFDQVRLTQRCDFFEESGTYTDCEELKKNLKELKKKYNINFVQISIPEEYTYVFRIMIPKEAISSVNEFILNNIDQYIPLTANEVYFDYKILKSHTTDSLVPVIVTAVPRLTIEKYTTLFDSCGMYVIGCEPETQAIARAVIYKGDANPYIILHVDEYATKISVVEEGFVQYTQTVSLKTADIIQNISPETKTLLKDTINKVIIYWFTSKEQHAQSQKIENIILTGDGVNSLEFINFFESNLSVNVVCADVWKNCFDITSYIPSISKENSLIYAIPIGLSMFKLK
jgi:Tfp pilus assembly PilM family ATPase